MEVLKLPWIALLCIVLCSFVNGIQETFLTKQELLDQQQYYVNSTLNVTNRKKKPKEFDSTNTIIAFEEVPYPIPLGALIYYLLLYIFILVWYGKTAVRNIMLAIWPDIILHSEQQEFPDITVYWLQQSERETRLGRDSRDTWPWVAKKYLLSPKDPLLDIEDAMTVHIHGNSTKRDVWAVLNAMLKINKTFEMARYKKEKLEALRLSRMTINNIHSSELIVPTISITRVQSDENAKKKKVKKVKKVKLKLIKAKTELAVPKRKRKKKKERLWTGMRSDADLRNKFGMIIDQTRAPPKPQPIKIPPITIRPMGKRPVWTWWRQ